MEKQQEILFSIVSESRNSVHHQNFQPQMVQAQPMNYQIDQFMRVSSEPKIGRGITSSAFKPSKCLPNINKANDPPVTPTPQQPQINPVGLNFGPQIGSGLSQTQLLSEI